MRFARLLAVAACASLSLTGNVWAQRGVGEAADAGAVKKAEAGAKTKIAVIKLSNELSERPADFSLSSITAPDTKSASLSQLIVTLNKAAVDKSLSGVMLDLRSFTLTLSQAQELGGLITKLREAHKRVAVYASDYDTGTYVLASYADTVIMPENGDIMMPGVGFGLVFFRGFFDKVNIVPDFVQIGKFKGAEEPFTRTEASPEFKAQIDGLADGLYEQLVTTIAGNRKQLEEKEIKGAIDEGWMPGKRAKELGLVDKLMGRTEVEDWFAAQFPDTPDVVTDYGEAAKKAVDFDNPFAIFALLGDPGVKTKTNQPAVAVIYADGEITGDTGGGLSDDGANVTPGRIRKAVDKAMDDPLVKAIVLRVDSPGGSASASDDIWQILKEADKTKPVTVSMGRMAASGGYYISCAGRTISADGATITGSIGVVGGKIVIKGLADKAGINIENVMRGKHADMFSAMTPFSDEERTFVTNLMTDTYHLFTARVKAGRGDKIKNIDDVAQGRLFTGPAAKEAGLVDEVRTLPETILAAAKTAGIERSYQIITLPEQKTLGDILREGLAVDAKLPLDVTAVLAAVPPEYRRATMEMLGMLHVMQEERVMLTAPLGLVEK